MNEYEIEIHRVVDMTKRGGSGMFVENMPFPYNLKFDYFLIWIRKYTKKETTCPCNNHYEGKIIAELKIPKKFKITRKNKWKFWN